MHSSVVGSNKLTAYMQSTWDTKRHEMEPRKVAKTTLRKRLIYSKLLSIRDLLHSSFYLHCIYSKFNILRDIAVSNYICLGRFPNVWYRRCFQFELSTPVDTWGPVRYLITAEVKMFSIHFWKIWTQCVPIVVFICFVYVFVLKIG